MSEVTVINLFSFVLFYGESAALEISAWLQAFVRVNCDKSYSVLSQIILMNVRKESSRDAMFPTLYTTIEINVMHSQASTHTITPTAVTTIKYTCNNIEDLIVSK
jgi:hypothetical protein